MSWIDNEPQNKPSLIAKDFADLGIPKKMTYSILLKRGVFKWLAVRRDLIKIKDVWKGILRELYNQQTEQKSEYRKGLIKGIEMCRKDIRGMCHSGRMRAPDFDKEAIKFLEEVKNERN